MIQRASRDRFARTSGTAQQHRVFDAEKQVGPTVGPAEAAGNSGDMDVDQAWSSKQLGRSRARLASYGK